VRGTETSLHPGTVADTSKPDNNRSIAGGSFIVARKLQEEDDFKTLTD
jgi:hypothetical protein